MGAPRTNAPFVVIGPDGKEYGAQTLATLGEWLGARSILPTCRVWSQATQKWSTVQEMGVRKTRSVFVTTGDLKRDYRVLDVVFGFVGKDTPAFGRVDIPSGFAEVTDQLATAAAALGAHAVVAASYSHQSGGAIGGMGFFGSGTAVQFVSEKETSRSGGS
jgi:hypothetical protein